MSAERTITQAEKWIGYLEKKSNAQLDDFTANAGKANYTRFGRDYGLNPAEWCGMFVSMVFVYEYGMEEAKRLLCGGLHHYTPTGANYFKKAGRYVKRGQGTPRPGDVVFFWSSSKGRIGHVGIVTEVTSNRVYTIEGNTSGANTLVTNGGGVKAKSYALTSTYIDGYGLVDYGGEYKPAQQTEKKEGKIMLEVDTLRKGAEGEQVKTVQRLLLAMGYKLPKYGADGDFGGETVTAVKAYQKDKGLTADGIVGAKTWKKLIG